MVSVLVGSANAALAYCPRPGFPYKGSNVNPRVTQQYFADFKSDRMVECPQRTNPLYTYVPNPVTGQYEKTRRTLDDGTPDSEILGYVCQGILFSHKGSAHYMDVLVDRSGQEFAIGSSRESVEQRDEHSDSGCTAEIKSFYKVYLPGGETFRAIGIVRSTYVYQKPDY